MSQRETRAQNWLHAIGAYARGLGSWIPKQCRSFNPSAKNSFGLRESEGASRVPGVGNPQFLGGTNAVAYCLCEKGGRSGKQMANQMGHSCGNEDTERIRCLHNPTGPDDGIRRECMKYLAQDNPSAAERLGEACESVVQCPPQSQAVAGVDLREQTLRCSCQSGARLVGGHNPNAANPQCGTIDCAQGPGDSALGKGQRQCCVLPGVDLGQEILMRPISRGISREMDVLKRSFGVRE